MDSQAYARTACEPNRRLCPTRSRVRSVWPRRSASASVVACDAVREAGTRDAVEVELGRGSADFPELLGRLTEFDYRGWVTIERSESPNPSGSPAMIYATLDALVSAGMDAHQMRADVFAYAPRP